MEAELSIDVKEEGNDGMEALRDCSSKGLLTEDKSVSVSNEGKVGIERVDDPAASVAVSRTRCTSTFSIVWRVSVKDICSSMTGDKGDILPGERGCESDMVQGDRQRRGHSRKESGKANVCSHRAGSLRTSSQYDGIVGLSSGIPPSTFLKMKGER